MKKILLGSLLSAICAVSNAGTVIGATGAAINYGVPGFGSIADTYNQNGLFTKYVSGVMDFATYISGNPMHNYLFSGNEWFSNQNSTTASVTYDLGSTKTIGAMALWNEEASGIGTLNLLSSTDGVSFFALLSGLMPIDSTNQQDYGVQVFSFTSTDFRYLRLDMSNCPQRPAVFNACAIGEVAFNALPDTTRAVPEPTTFALLGLGLVGFVVSRRKSAK